MKKKDMAYFLDALGLLPPNIMYAPAASAIRTTAPMIISVTGHGLSAAGVGVTGTGVGVTGGLTGAAGAAALMASCFASFASSSACW